MSGNIFTIIFFVLLAGLLFATAILYAQNNPTTVEENRHNRILALTNDAIFLAIIFLMRAETVEGRPGTKCSGGSGFWLKCWFASVLMEMARNGREPVIIW